MTRESFCPSHRIRYGRGGCPLCRKASSGPSPSSGVKAGGVVAGGLLILLAAMWFISFDSEVVPESDPAQPSTSVPASAAKPARTGEDYREVLAAMELALDQLGRLIDTAEFEYSSMPERIEDRSAIEDFQQFSRRFEEDLENFLDMPPFPKQKDPKILKSVHSLLSRTRTQVARLRFPNSYPSAGARQSLLERCRRYHREAGEALRQAKRDLMGEME